ncbi:hypothetical protein V6N13_044468 [Hibiscus sabdariffa]|uniref:Uncharacterized protein n=1 Tax=Hibiscus sabdariffa TaxID=183260 RepID=A0ABR2RIN8_9ROSI
MPGEASSSHHLRNMCRTWMIMIPRQWLAFILLRELEAATSSKFEYLLTLISGPKLQSKSTGWLLASKLLNHKRTMCEQARKGDINELEKVDAALRSLLSPKMSKSENVMNVESKNEQIMKMELTVSSGVYDQN